MIVFVFDNLLIFLVVLASSMEILGISVKNIYEYDRPFDWLTNSPDR